MSETKDNMSKKQFREMRNVTTVFIVIITIWLFYSIGTVMTTLDKKLVISTVYKYETVQVIDKNIVNDEYVVEVKVNDITGKIYSKELYTDVKLGDNIEVPLKKQINSKNEVISSEIIGLK